MRHEFVRSDRSSMIADILILNRRNTGKRELEKKPTLPAPPGRVRNESDARAVGLRVNPGEVPVTHSDETITGPIRVQSNTAEIDHALLTRLLLSTLSFGRKPTDENQSNFVKLNFFSPLSQSASLSSIWTINFNEYCFDEANLAQSRCDDYEYRSYDTKFHNRYCQEVESAISSIESREWYLCIVESRAMYRTKRKSEHPFYDLSLIFHRITSVKTADEVFAITVMPIARISKRVGNQAGSVLCSSWSNAGISVLHADDRINGYCSMWKSNLIASDRIDLTETCRISVTKALLPKEQCREQHCSIRSNWIERSRNGLKVSIISIRHHLFFYTRFLLRFYIRIVFYKTLFGITITRVRNNGK